MHPRTEPTWCPYENVHVSNDQRQQLIKVVKGCVETHFQRYQTPALHQVDDRRFQRFKSKEELHVYTERSLYNRGRKGGRAKHAVGKKESDMAVIISTGTIMGELEDLMFGIVNTTNEAMRLRAAYVGAMETEAILCSVVEPSEKDPFRSLVIKWMATDVTSDKSRDFVCIEATDMLQLEDGERIGFHLLHSIEFPQTKPLPHITRGNQSYVSFFRHIHRTMIDTCGYCLVDPGVQEKHHLFVTSAANAILLATNYVHCGQMKKLAWLLQRQHAGFKFHKVEQLTTECVVCGKRKSIPGMSRRTCKLCYGNVCFSCKVRARMKFIGRDGHLLERKITFCSQCMSNAINGSTHAAAQAQALCVQESSDTSSMYSDSTYSEMSLSDLVKLRVFLLRHVHAIRRELGSRERRDGVVRWIPSRLIPCRGHCVHVRDVAHAPDTKGDFLTHERSVRREETEAMRSCALGTHGFETELAHALADAGEKRKATGCKRTRTGATRTRGMEESATTRASCLGVPVLQCPRQFLGVSTADVVCRGEERLGRCFERHGSKHVPPRVHCVHCKRVDHVATTLAIEANDFVSRTNGPRAWGRGWKVDRVKQLVAHAVTVGKVQDARGLETDKVSIVDEASLVEREIDLRPLDGHGTERIVTRW
ncbi:hypothetical protein PsorP6_017755 [Peronosclerospora sorghi]|uniref:Uncharacterized protein n=1 Tax=Peronosclerospora sorghi TaxID=230839 RepID=A0ACC0WKJ0_9STRA|nr:hypothetical protein PsorP6_017755 [Peronosclerospora sorghi]